MKDRHEIRSTLGILTLAVLLLSVVNPGICRVPACSWSSADHCSDTVPDGGLCAEDPGHEECCGEPADHHCRSCEPGPRRNGSHEHGPPPVVIPDRSRQEAEASVAALAASLPAIDPFSASVMPVTIRDCQAYATLESLRSVVMLA